MAKLLPSSAPNVWTNSKRLSPLFSITAFASPILAVTISGRPSPFMSATATPLVSSEPDPNTTGRPNRMPPNPIRISLASPSLLAITKSIRPSPFMSATATFNVRSSTAPNDRGSRSSPAIVGNDPAPLFRKIRFCVPRLTSRISGAPS